MSRISPALAYAPALAVSIVSWLAAVGTAAPTITDISLRGLEIGGTTVIRIRGTELTPDPQLVLPFPVAQQKVLDGATAETVEIEVELDDKRLPGIFPLRIASSTGVSNAVPIGVDRLPQRPFAEQADSLPIALHGTLAGSEIKTTSFQGRRAMRIVVEVETRRLGTELRPVIRILDERGRQIEWSQGIDDLLGDARCIITLPADGRYHVQLHDAIYRAPQPGFFRLKIGELDYADTVFPLGVQRGQSASVQLLAHNKPADRIDVTVPADSLDDWMPVRSRSPWFTGTAPRVAISDHEELVEDSSAGGVQELSTVPIAVSGRLSEPREEDQYALVVQPGARLRLELYSQRLGGLLDGVLLVRTEAGVELARGDDQPGTSDPFIEVTAPADASKLVVVVQDLLGRGGEMFVYRLAVRDLAQPSMTLTMDRDRVMLGPGGGQVVQVVAQRANYDGPIELELENLPAGVEVSGQTIAAGTNRALLTLRGADIMPGYTRLRVLGRAQAGERSVTAAARQGESFINRLQPWYREELYLVGVAPAPITLTWSPGESAVLPRNNKLAAPIQLERREGVSGNVRLRLLTTQEMPKKKIVENNMEKVVDDVERALRLEGDVLLDANTTTATAQVVVPADLPDTRWGLVLVAELLAADNQTVIASDASACHFFQPVTPLAVELTSEAKVRTQAGGEAAKFTGKVQRADGYAGPVVVRLAGLPEGYPVPTVTVPADQGQFELPVEFPAEVAPAELKNLELFATLDVAPETTMRSVSIPVEIVVTRAAQPSE